MDAVQGSTCESTLAWRTRRAISCVYWPPKSNITMQSATENLLKITCQRNGNLFLDAAVGVEQGQLFQEENVLAVFRGAFGKDGHLPDHGASGFIDQLFNGLG